MNETTTTLVRGVLITGSSVLVTVEEESLLETRDYLFTYSQSRHRIMLTTFTLYTRKSKRSKFTRKHFFDLLYPFKNTLPEFPLVPDEVYDLALEKFKNTLTISKRPK